MRKPRLLSRNPQPLIVITGPTASGKTALAIKLAKKWGGEIICADSRTVYKDMDIGTAKPTPGEQHRVPHWLLDVALPSERFTVADFQKLANEAIKNIRSRGKIPFLVGGTGLYIDAVVLGFKLGPLVDPLIRSKLENLSVEQLQTLIVEQHLVMPENKNNKRYLIRCIEKNNVSKPVKLSPDADTYVVAIEVEREELRERIAQRADAIFASNILQETQHLFKKYGSGGEAMTGNIYPIIGKMIAGELSEEQAKQVSVSRDWQLAKRQITWLKRHDYVKWLPLAEAEEHIEGLLAQIRR